MFKIIIGVVIATIALIVTLSITDAITKSINNTQMNISNSVDDENTLSLTIEGEVNKPGTYLLDVGSTLSSLIDAAGGVNNNADPLAYDLSYLLEDNQTFYIAPIYDVDDICNETPLKKVCINSASEEELMSINGIKSNIATNIVSYRTTTPFKRIEDLLNVSYIGNATFEKIKNYVTLR